MFDLAMASGSAWYASSFSWSDFEKNKCVLIKRTHDVDLRDYGISRNLTAAEKLPVIVSVFFTGNDFGHIAPAIVVTDESSSEDEFFWPVALEYASKAQGKKMKNSYFRFFKNGRTNINEYSKPDEKCITGYDTDKNWGYCGEVFIILSPNEIKEFYVEMVKFNRDNHTKEYQPYFEALQSLLLKAISMNKGLFFEQHD